VEVIFYRFETWVGSEIFSSQQQQPAAACDDRQLDCLKKIVTVLLNK